MDNLFFIIYLLFIYIYLLNREFIGVYLQAIIVFL